MALSSPMTSANRRGMEGWSTGGGGAPSTPTAQISHVQWYTAPADPQVGQSSTSEGTLMDDPLHPAALSTRCHRTQVSFRDWVSTATPT